METILYFIPKGSVDEALFYLVLNNLFVFYAIDAESVGHVFVNGLREGIGFLKDHSNTASYVDYVGTRSVDIIAVEEDLACYPDVCDNVVHAVKTPQEGRLAATGRSNERRYAVFRHVEGYALDGARITIVDFDVSCRNLVLCVGIARG